MGAIDTTVTRDGLRNAAQRSMTPWLDRRQSLSGPETDYGRGRGGNNRSRYFRGPRSVIESCTDVCPTTSRGAARGSKMAPESVRPGGGGH